MSSRTTSIGGVISLLGAFLASALVLGLLAAGLVMPAVGATGALARSGVDVFNELPSEFSTDPLAQTSQILASDGTVIATPQEQNRTIVPLAKIAPIMREAQVAIEDHRFYEHGGIDLQGTIRAVVSNLRNGSSVGASSLTQQYVKISLQYSALSAGNEEAAADAIKKDYMRKLKELKYAITLEKKLSKDEILEGYLNLVYYGDRAYGVEAAAKHYFSVPAAKLSLSQAALLAGLTQNPGTTDPVNFPQRARRPPQRRARPHARARQDHRQAVDRREEAHAQAGHEGHQPQEHLPRLALPLLVRLRHQLRDDDAPARQDGRGAQAHALPRRHHHHDDARPARPAHRPGRDQQAGADRQRRARRRGVLHGRPQHGQGAGLRPEHRATPSTRSRAARPASAGPSTRSTAAPAASSSGRRPRPSPSSPPWSRA